MFHGIADGDWADFSAVRHSRVGDDNVISFRVRDRDALQRMIDRLDFRPGVPGGNTAKLSDSLLLAAGLYPDKFDRYSSSEGPSLLFLYVHSNECALVSIRY